MYNDNEDIVNNIYNIPHTAFTHLIRALFSKLSFSPMMKIPKRENFYALRNDDKNPRIIMKNAP